MQAGPPIMTSPIGIGLLTSGFLVYPRINLGFHMPDINDKTPPDGLILGLGQCIHKFCLFCVSSLRISAYPLIYSYMGIVQSATVSPFSNRMDKIYEYIA